MDWLNNPTYARLRDRLIKGFQGRVLEFRNIKKLIFLCGGANSKSRYYLSRYIEKHHHKFLTFYADDVWKILSEREDLNALQMEDKLAQLSDAVIIVAESPGTFTELGAFSLSDKLRKKVLPILDKKYKDEDSFINTGPIRWVNKDSKFKPTIYTDLISILQSAKELDKRLNKIKFREDIFDIENIGNSPKHLLFLIFDLLTIISPAPEHHVNFYLKEIAKSKPSWEITSLLGLGIALKIIDYIEYKDKKYYYRLPSESTFKSFVHKRMINLANERAIILNSLIRIPEARKIIGIINEKRT